VAGGELRSTANLDWNAIYDGLDKRDRAEVSKRMLKTHPDARKAHRDRVRTWLAAGLVIAVFLDSAAALGLALAEEISWSDLRDWLTLAVVPLTTGIAVALAFWYPTKEIE